MTNNGDSVFDIKKAYPDMTDERALLLSQRLLSWLTVLGTSVTARVAEAKLKGEGDTEELAVILATSVVARMFSMLREPEVDRLNSLLDSLLTVTPEPVTP